MKDGLPRLTTPHSILDYFPTRLLRSCAFTSAEKPFSSHQWAISLPVANHTPLCDFMWPMISDKVLARPGAARDIGMELKRTKCRRHARLFVELVEHPFPDHQSIVGVARVAMAVGAAVTEGLARQLDELFLAVLPDERQIVGERIAVPQDNPAPSSSSMLLGLWVQERQPTGRFCARLRIMSVVRFMTSRSSSLLRSRATS